MILSSDKIRQVRVDAAILAMHQEAARGMRLFPKDRHYKRLPPPVRRRLRASRHLLRGRYPFLRLRATQATLEDIQAAFDYRYNRIARRGGDEEWFRDKWLEGIGRAGHKIPYTESFASAFTQTVQEQRLQQLHAWLHSFCQAWSTGTCDQHDFDYLIDVLNEPLLRQNATQPELLKRAITWLTTQRKKALGISPDLAIEWPDSEQAHREFLGLFVNATNAADNASQAISLLKDWKVISTEAPHLWYLENLKGKARAVKSAFPALYNALVETRVARDLPAEVWAPIFMNRFRVQFTIKHARKTQHERGAAYDLYYNLALRHFQAL